MLRGLIPILLGVAALAIASSAIAAPPCNCPGGCPAPIPILQTHTAELPVAVIVAKGPVRAILWSASWCGPCRAMHRHVENEPAGVCDRLAAEGWDLGFIDLDEHPARAEANGIVQVPTIQIGTTEAELFRKTGVLGIDELRLLLRTYGVARKPARP